MSKPKKIMLGKIMRTYRKVQINNIKVNKQNEKLNK